MKKRWLARDFQDFHVENQGILHMNNSGGILSFERIELPAKGVLISFHAYTWPRREPREVVITLKKISAVSEKVSIH